MNIALLLVDGFEDVEAFAPKDILERAGQKVMLVSVNNQDIVTSSKNIRVLSDLLYQEIHLNDFDLIIMPGGPGVSNYKQNTTFIQDLKARTEKCIAAICAAPTILAECGLLDHKQATGFPTTLEALKKQGVIVIDQDVVIDGHILTSRAMGTSIDFGLAIVYWLLSKELAQTIKTQICYKN